MATLTWTQVQPWLRTNPHKVPLVSYKSATISIQGHPETEGLFPGWTKKSVAPATPLSGILLAQDVLYSGLTEDARRTMLRDQTTDLQEKSVLHLKGRQWPIRRTAEGIVAAGLEEGKSWPELGWEALCSLRECQILLLNEDKKQVSCFPSDLRTWSSSTPILIFDHEMRYVHKQAKPFFLGLWFSQQEQAGWSLPWPVADGTVVELKAAAEKVNETVPAKITKDALSKRVGRAEAIHLLSQWSQ